MNDVVQKYRDALVRTGTLDPKQANPAADEAHACYKVLHETEEGRTGIMSLMSDPNPHVRLGAAAHSLQWNRQLARRTLEELRDSDGPGSFDAEMTLQELDAGRLDITYNY